MRVCTLNAAGGPRWADYLDALDGKFRVLALLAPRRIDRPVVVLDAEVTAGDLAAAAGVEVLAVTRPVSVRRTGVVQVAERTTGGKSAGRVARIVREQTCGPRGRSASSPARDSGARPK